MTRGLRYPPFAKPGSPVAQQATRQVELPPIEDFLDDLPSIDDFLADDFSPSGTSETFEDYQLEPQAEPQSEDGWAAGSWQSYDWSSISYLNRSTSSAVDSADAWSESDWPDPAPPVPARSGNPTADEIAAALDGMAHRIRTGELVVDKLQGTSPEAAMAAALAVLLRMRG